jgi:hypothetical protein
MARPLLCFGRLDGAARLPNFAMTCPNLRALFFAFLVCAGSLAAQVSLKRGAVVYTGSAANTSSPAHIDEARAKQATKEWQRIQSEGIDQDSALGKQLLQQMNSKIREAAKAVAQDESRDLVVRKDDVSDAQGKDVVDLTDKVISKLGQ